MRRRARRRVSAVYRGTADVFARRRRHKATHNDPPGLSAVQQTSIAMSSSNQDPGGRLWVCCFGDQRVDRSVVPTTAPPLPPIIPPASRAVACDSSDPSRVPVCLPRHAMCRYRRVGGRWHNGLVGRTRGSSSRRRTYPLPPDSAVAAGSTAPRRQKRDSISMS